MVDDGICLFNTEKGPNDTSSSNCHLHQSLHHVDLVSTEVGVNIVVVVGGSSLLVVVSVSTEVGVDIVVVVGESSLLVVVRVVHVVPFSSSV